MFKQVGLIGSERVKVSKRSLCSSTAVYVSFPVLIFGRVFILTLLTPHADYDALTFSYAPPEPSTAFPPPNLDFDTTIFSIASQDHLLDTAKKLVSKLRAEHAYTDTATFTFVFPLPLQPRALLLTHLLSP
jgi:hypothetical protein